MRYVVVCTIHGSGRQTYGMVRPEFSALHSVRETLISNMAVSSICTPVQVPSAVILCMCTSCILFYYVNIVNISYIRRLKGHIDMWTYTPGQLVGVTLNETPGIGVGSKIIL